MDSVVDKYVGGLFGLVRVGDVVVDEGLRVGGGRL